MEMYMWLILASMLVIGTGIGFIVGRSKNDAINKITALEEELKTAQAEMADYRGQVVEHFGKTAGLFNQLTNDYRAVHQHLAVSSEALCGDQVAKLIGTDSENSLVEESIAATADINEAQGADNVEQEMSSADVTIEEETSAEPSTETVSPASLEEKAAEARTIH